MKMFTLKALGIAFLMFACVLFGMQQANGGILKMKGYEDENFSSALAINNEQGGLEASILGSDVTSHDLQKKKEQMEEMKTFNLLSGIGKGVADGVSSLAQKGVDLVSGVINKDKDTGNQP
ncbi:DUF3679 domain-containing protein [Niallia taxi]|uniref:DUF3679 domain-containing protein n=1 Tax=Niallia taxi TaxID=2499688 RepID=A0A3S2UGR0_9BACI|nr:DUF3679 domain-containing protein [Niallia taxi]MCM3215314.1 YqxA family protein [Niallia taxi]MCT2343249.1 YqxA family protein [Niallia taxi]MDE5052230.1 DUF3679 domain-containing protein [Niallia taxi]MDK8639615.1 DUF3679 domain-containing protein [Niallia taxi]MED3962084.1 DUF3679 domain-containing protein [Niallia taxi]